MAGEENNEMIEEGKTVIIRGQKGEVVLSSNSKKDKLKDMAAIARETYDQSDIPPYCA